MTVGCGTISSMKPQFPYMQRFYIFVAVIALTSFTVHVARGLTGNGLPYYQWFLLYVPFQAIGLILFDKVTNPTHLVRGNALLWVLSLYIIAQPLLAYKGVLTIACIAMTLFELYQLRQFHAMKQVAQIIIGALFVAAPVLYIAYWIMYLIISLT